MLNIIQFEQCKSKFYKSIFFYFMVNHNELLHSCRNNISTLEFAEYICIYIYWISQYNSYTNEICPLCLNME